MSESIVPEVPHSIDLEWVDLRNSDLEIVKAIYDHYILHSTATFHTEKISLAELREVIPIGHPKYQSFLIRLAGEVCGYCYISQHKKRQAYDRAAEVTLYLKPECTSKGLGRRTLQHLEAIAFNNGIRVLIGVLTGDNTPSIRLFEKCGYEKCAHFKAVGEKFGKILDVVAYQKMLGN